MKKQGKISQLWQLISAAFFELIREPGILFWGFLFPVLMTLGLGLAFTKKPDVTRKIALIRTPETPSVDSTRIGKFLAKYGDKDARVPKDEYRYSLTLNNEQLGKSVFLFYPMSWDSSMTLLKRGSISLLIREEKGRIVYHFDPQNSDAELIWLKISPVIGRGEVVPEKSSGEIKPLTVTGTRYIDFLVPGMIAMGVMMSCMWGISYGLIEKRSKKLLRRMVATPMKKTYFLVSVISVRVLLNFLESFILFLFAMLVFKITIQGDISALILLYLAGNVAFAGMAVFVSSHTSNTEVGNGLINFVVTPMMVLSGIFFSYHNFPDWSIPVIRKLPLTILTDAMRSIINEGAGYAQVATPVLVLLLIGVVLFAAGMKIFKWH
jgi:ABC-2 type transport system permease protein